MSDHSNDPSLVFRTLHDYKEPPNKMTKGHHDPVSDEQPEGESISEAKEGSPVSPLKRKAADMAPYPERNKRFQTSDNKNYARNKINADEELWSILTALKEESRTPGVIPRLEPQFTSLNRKGNTVAAYLCSPYTDHIATGFMDLGWGCGYRNCQMLMTFLQRQKEAGDYILRQVADISGLQLLLERAWSEGFDPQGAEQLNHRVYKTRKWIGTTEVYCMLVYLGIRCTILDFHRPSGPNNSHDTMFDWIQSYFEGGVCSSTTSSPSPDDSCHESHRSKRKKTVHITDRPPLYLQHSGHSRTVIGIELLKDGKRNLIMFDPGRRMLRSYRKTQTATPTAPEDDIDESALSSSVTGDEDDSDDDSDDFTSRKSKDDDPQGKKPTSFTSRLLSGWTNRAPLPANLLRPFRVDAKTIAKNRQYQLLVLGEVLDQRDQGGQLVWNGEKGYLLNMDEREAMKKVTSMGAL